MLPIDRNTEYFFASDFLMDPNLLHWSKHQHLESLNKIEENYRSYLPNLFPRRSQCAQCISSQQELKIF